MCYLCHLNNFVSYVSRGLEGSDHPLFLDLDRVTAGLRFTLFVNVYTVEQSFLHDRYISVLKVPNKVHVFIAPCLLRSPGYGEHRERGRKLDARLQHTAALCFRAPRTSAPAGIAAAAPELRSARAGPGPAALALPEARGRRGSPSASWPREPGRRAPLPARASCVTRRRHSRGSGPGGRVGRARGDRTRWREEAGAATAAGGRLGGRPAAAGGLGGDGTIRGWGAPRSGARGRRGWRRL